MFFWTIKTLNTLNVTLNSMNLWRTQERGEVPNTWVLKGELLVLGPKKHQKKCFHWESVRISLFWPYPPPPSLRPSVNFFWFWFLKLCIKKLFKTLITSLLTWHSRSLVLSSGFPVNRTSSYAIPSSLKKKYSKLSSNVWQFDDFLFSNLKILNNECNYKMTAAAWRISLF